MAVSASYKIERAEIDLGAHVHTALTCGPEDGDLVLLLHGFPETADCWTSQLTALGAAGYRALAPNQRGYTSGARPAEKGAYATEELVKDALDFANFHGAERFHVVGHDWGGVFAWHVAALEPDRVITLTSVTTPHPAAFTESLPRSTQLLRSSYIALFRTPWVAEQVLSAGDFAVLRQMLERSGLRAEFSRRYIEALREPGALTAALNWYRAAGTTTSKVGAITVPTLYVWGGKDSALGPEAARRTEKYVTGPYRFEALEDAPHWIPEERPDQLNKLLLDFTQRHAS
jgi:pimeloyl-ACP methyl ester carboxylesterase